MNNLNILTLLSKRKSSRLFANEQLTEEELQNLLYAANGAPIAQRRFDDINIYIIQHSELLTQIEHTTQLFYSKIGYKIKGIYETPTLILITVRSLEEPYLKSLYCSAACMTENMIMAATEMNLGSVFLTGVTTALNQSPKMLDMLGIAEDYQAATALAVGHITSKLVPRDLSIERFQTFRL